MVKALFIHYPKCDTCRRADKWLRENGVEFDTRDIVTDKPTENELRDWIARSGMLAAKFFNTSGLKYKEMGLKDVVKRSSDDDLIKLLASDGMLVKRPLLITQSGVMVGFKPDLWSKSTL